jgi:hypothetical protein
MRIDRYLLRLLRLAAVTIALTATMPAAQAQWGMGWGWGLLGPQESAATRFTNEHALSRVGIVGARQPGRSHSPYTGSSNAYFNRIRDNGFVSHYDVRRRRAPSYQPARSASVGNSGLDTARQTSRPPAPPLLDFFDASLRLVWPQESPIDGDFKEKRDISDQATLDVLKQTKSYGAAAITTATQARQKLVDYGKTALQHLRAAATPPIADSFHRFLLSLYDSLEAAAWPPETSSGSRP